MTEPVERFIPKPSAVDTFETRLGRAIPVHPHVLSALKLLVVTPLVAAGLLGGVQPLRSTLAVIGLFCAFGLLDALDGIVARAQGLDTDAGRLVERLTDPNYFAGVPSTIGALVAQIARFRALLAAKA